MKQNKAPKQIDAPKWNESYQDQEVKGIEKRYGGILAKNLAQLARQITEAHKALQVCQDFTDRTDIKVYTEADGKRLEAFAEIGGPYSELSMVLFDGTVKPVMLALYSAVRLEPDIRSQADNENFYHNLENCLRFVDSNVSTSVASADTIDRYNTPHIDYNTPNGDALEPNRSKWLYLGGMIRKAPKTQDLIDKVNSWQNKLLLDSNSLSASRSRPLSRNQWKDIFGIGKNKMGELIKGDQYHFEPVGQRKWTLPVNELPAEYLAKYLEQESA